MPSFAFYPSLPPFFPAEFILTVAAFMSLAFVASALAVNRDPGPAAAKGSLAGAGVACLYWMLGLLLEVLF